MTAWLERKIHRARGSRLRMAVLFGNTVGGAALSHNLAGLPAGRIVIGRRRRAGKADFGGAIRGKKRSVDLGAPMAGHDLEELRRIVECDVGFCVCGHVGAQRSAGNNRSRADGPRLRDDGRRRFIDVAAGICGRVTGRTERIGACSPDVGQKVRSSRRWRGQQKGGSGLRAAARPATATPAQSARVVP